MTYQEIINKVSRDTGISSDIVDKTYKAFWKFIKDSIEALPLKDDLTEEEFNTLRTNFNIPSLGKLYCSYDRYVGVKKRFRYLNEFTENR